MIYLFMSYKKFILLFLIATLSRHSFAKSEIVNDSYTAPTRGSLPPNKRIDAYLEAIDIEFPSSKIQTQWLRKLPLERRYLVLSDTGCDWQMLLVSLDDPDAAKRQVRGLEYGIDGYERDHCQANQVNEVWVAKGALWAVENKIEGLQLGRYGYAKNPGPESRDLNDILVAQGNELAILRKISGLTKGKYGYRQDFDQAKAFIDEQSVNGSSSAIVFKIDGLLTGDYGYTRCAHQAKKFIDEWASKGSEPAMKKKTDGLWYGEYGYIQNPDQIRESIEEWVSKGYQWAINTKTEGSAYGIYGYQKAPEQAKKLNDQRIAESDEAAMINKVSWLLKGTNGYARDIDQAVKLIDDWAANRNQWAVDAKIDGFINGNGAFEKNTESLWAFAKQYDPYVYHYLQAAGYWLRTFGLEKDQEKSTRIMNVNGICF